MNKKNVLIMALAIVLTAVFSIGGTIAWLTSSTGVVTNTFSYGDLTITLDEAKVDEYGDPVANAARVTANKYKLVPGHSYTKDPTVHIAEESEPCYVFVKVTNDIVGIEAATTIATQMSTNGWLPLTDKEGNDVANVYYYAGNKATTDEKGNMLVDARDAAVDLLVFGTFTLQDTVVDLSTYQDKTVTIDAFAVQADGFDDVADAWTAFSDWGN